MNLFKPSLVAIFAMLILNGVSAGEIAIITPAEAHKLIAETDTAKKPIVIDTRGG